MLIDSKELKGWVLTMIYVMEEKFDQSDTMYKAVEFANKKMALQDVYLLIEHLEQQYKGEV